MDVHVPSPLSVLVIQQTEVLTRTLNPLTQHEHTRLVRACGTHPLHTIPMRLQPEERIIRRVVSERGNGPVPDNENTSHLGVLRMREVSVNHLEEVSHSGQPVDTLVTTPPSMNRFRRLGE